MIDAEVIDAAIHPMVHDNDELRQYLKPSFRDRLLPTVHRYYYPAPEGEWLPESWGPHDELPCSDPDLLARHLFQEGEVKYAILLPLTRGMLRDIDLGSAVCSATNDWLAETWLGRWNSHGRFWGTIRVNPRDPEGAVAEIERWAGHPKMIQVGVPLEAHQPYGQRIYSPIWETAARHNLPIAVHADGGTGVDLLPTASGYPRHHIEYISLMPLNYFYHLSSLIAEGVFDRLPDLKFVFADGGSDLLMPLMWRLEMEWRMTRRETPWTKQIPGAYLASHVRFCASRLEGPTDGGSFPEWLEVIHARELLLFATNYPHWSFVRPGDFGANLPAELHGPIFEDNARDFYTRLS